MKEPDRPGICMSVIWASVILAAAVLLYDTPYLTTMLVILGCGAGATLVVLSRGRREEENS